MAERKKEMLTITYWDGKGKYQDDYDRLVDLAPKSGKKADTLGGEIMRAVAKLNHDFYTNETLNNSADAISLLALAGIFDQEMKFDENNSALPKEYDFTINRDKTQMAVERIIDRTIEFILEYPDLEYAENTIDMSTLCRVQPDFMERMIATLAAAAAADRALQIQKIGTPTKDMPLQEMNTPRMANKASSDTAGNA